MVSWINTASPSQFHLGIPQRLEQVSPMYHILWGGGHDIRRSWVAFVLTSSNRIQEILHGTGQKGGAELKSSWSIFVNTYMYHLCVK